MPALEVVSDGSLLVEAEAAFTLDDAFSTVRSSCMASYVTLQDGVAHKKETRKAPNNFMVVNNSKFVWVLFHLNRT